MNRDITLASCKITAECHTSDGNWTVSIKKTGTQELQGPTAYGVISVDGNNYALTEGGGSLAPKQTFTQTSSLEDTSYPTEAICIGASWANKATTYSPDFNTALSECMNVTS